jgi:hypothetical protein
MSSYVYVVQQQYRYDPEAQAVVPKHDLSPAQQYGELRVLLHHRTTIEHERSTSWVVSKMNLLLRNFCDQDYLLLVGHPSLIGLALALAAANNDGRVKQLIWDSRHRFYTPVEVLLPIQYCELH